MASTGEPSVGAKLTGAILLLAALATVLSFIWQVMPDKGASAPPVPSQSATPSASTDNGLLEVPSQPSVSPKAVVDVDSELPDTDLGLDQKITVLPCDDRYVTILKNVIHPNQYEDDVTAALSLYPNSNYMVTAGGCDALRQVSSIGTSIYSVYLGPFEDRNIACSEAKNAIPPASNKIYVKKLTAGKDPLTSVECP